MTKPLIAIVGRLSSDKFDESPVKEVDILRGGLVKIGKALGDSDFRIMVYTADPKLDYAAKYVVQGYRQSRKKITAQSIIVKRAAVGSSDRFPEEDTDPRYLLDVRAEEPWEIRFYFSMFEIDGIVVVGNGNFTYFGGLHAVGSQMPLLALGGFGGVATNILALVKNKIPDEAYSCMAQTRGDEAWTEDCVASLREQIESARRVVERNKEERELRQVIWAAVFTTAIVVVLLAALAESLRSDWNSWVRAYGTAFVPALAGLVGALQRIVFAHFRGENLPSHRRSFWVCGALGFSAGGTLGAVYTLTQVKMGSGKPESAMAPLFLWAITFGYGVGFSLDRAFSRLLHIDEAASAKAHEKGRNAKGKSLV